MSKTKEYIFGTNEAELGRLRFQHGVWKPVTDPFLDSLNIEKGWKCLDAGSGPGFTSMELRQRVGDEGEVTSLDPSEYYLDWYKSYTEEQGWTNVNFINGFVEDAELPEGYYDLVFSRWVISFVPDHEKFLKALIKSLKPGGIIAIEDYSYDGLALYPKGGAWDGMPEVVRKYYRLGHGDPYVGSKLPGYFRKLGLEMTYFKPVLLGGGPESGIMEWAERFFTIHIPIMIEKGVVTEAEGKALADDWNIHKNNPDSIFFSPIVVDIVAKLP